MRLIDADELKRKMIALHDELAEKHIDGFPILTVIGYIEYAPTVETHNEYWKSIEACTSTATYNPNIK